MPLGRFPSPLRYPGGKGKVANFMKLLFLENGLVGGEYVEPYAGGASVALSLLFEEYASHVHINDINRSVYAFWWAVLNHPGELCRRIWDAQLTMDEWHVQRAVQNDADADPLDRAFSTFFMNRCNRSGIIGGGVIGGQDQTGTWKIDARFNREDLTRRIEKIARYRDRISLSDQDALAFLEPWVSGDAKASLIYLDPPYYVKGEGLYENFYEHEHHVAIADRVKALAGPWVVSYDAAPEILKLYNFARPTKYSLSYSAADRYKGSEIMFFSKGLRIPTVDTPALVSPEIVSEKLLGVSVI
ncbi:MAG TPA: DNA adenine methylase [Acidimicrobiales bacterium]|nr:DNA adenine methylase [Acidimicrobiales bacterium]